MWIEKIPKFVTGTKTPKYNRKSCVVKIKSKVCVKNLTFYIQPREWYVVRIISNFRNRNKCS